MLLTHACKHYMTLDQSYFEADCEQFAEWLQKELLPIAGTSYWGVDDCPPAIDAAVNVHITMLGFGKTSTTKPFPFGSVCFKLAQEFAKDGFVTSTEPLRVFQRPNATAPFELGFVKGAARFSTACPPCIPAKNAQKIS